MLFILYLCTFALSSLSHNKLNQWWTPKDFGSVGLLDTSSYIDPYRTDTSYFRPYIYGFVSNTEPITTNSLEECMDLCIQDINCKAFEINMLFLPFRCRLPVKPCIDGSCSEFQSHPQWKHFVRDNFNTPTSGLSTVSIDTVDNKYTESKYHKISGYAIEEFTNNTVFDYIEIETVDSSANSILIDYVWFEYKLTSSSNWLKCQRVQLPQVKTQYSIQNRCIQYEFDGMYASECNKLKESWEYHSITPRTTKIRNIHFDHNQIPSLQTCRDSISNIRYEKLGIVYAVRLFSNDGKFSVNKINLIALQQTYDVDHSVITTSGDNAFKLPHDSTNISADSRMAVADWYYNILKDGGHLWCRKPLNLAEPIIATNVFQRMHHTCYYRGSTLSKNTKTFKSDNDRVHYFQPEQCTFDINNIPNCTKAWVSIHERCQEWNYCAGTLKEASDVQIYHTGDKGLNNMFDGKSVDFPIVSWKSGWNRAQSKDSEHNWSVDYKTDIFLVLHDCLDEFDDLSGCAQCSSEYFEAEYNPKIKYANSRIYKYDPTEQFCRPQSGIWENECKENVFCPKGPINDFQDHQYWQCRTNFHGMQHISTVTQTIDEPVNQGFACVTNETLI